LQVGRELDHGGFQDSFALNGLIPSLVL